MWSLTSEKWEGAGSTIRTSHPFNLGSVILECVSAASAFGDPNKEVPKAPYFFGVFDESYVGSPNALTMFARSRMTDNSASTDSSFFTGSSAAMTWSGGNVCRRRKLIGASRNRDCRVRSNKVAAATHRQIDLPRATT